MNQTGVQNYFDSPVVVQKHDMYPINNYGSALAPFYISISLWIGCIIAAAMISMRVKSRIKYRAESVYLGRMGLFIVISILQSILVAFRRIISACTGIIGNTVYLDNIVHWFLFDDNRVFININTG